jgi:hypothetical protein
LGYIHTFFRGTSIVSLLTKNGLGSNFGRFFSQAHLVTLFPIEFNIERTTFVCCQIPHPMQISRFRGFEAKISRQSIAEAEIGFTLMPPLYLLSRQFGDRGRFNEAKVGLKPVLRSFLVRLPTIPIAVVRVCNAFLESTHHRYLLQ